MPEDKKTEQTNEPDGVDRVRVWPRKGETVTDEFTGQPIEAGAVVERTRLTERRLARGELTLKPPTETNEPDAKTGGVREAFRSKE